MSILQIAIAVNHANLSQGIFIPQPFEVFSSTKSQIAHTTSPHNHNDLLNKCPVTHTHHSPKNKFHRPCFCTC